MEKQDIKNKKARGRSVLKICIAIVIVAALIFGATMALRSRVVSVVVINGDGMADSMRDSERWAVDRLKNDYSGGDIVTFKESEDSDDVMGRSRSRRRALYRFRDRRRIRKRFGLRRAVYQRKDQI